MNMKEYKRNLTVSLERLSEILKKREINAMLRKDEELNKTLSQEAYDEFATVIALQDSILPGDVDFAYILGELLGNDG